MRTRNLAANNSSGAGTAFAPCLHLGREPANAVRTKLAARREQIESHVAVDGSRREARLLPHRLEAPEDVAGT